MNEETRVVTVQSAAPMFYALIAGLVYGLIGAVEGAIGALVVIQQASGDVSFSPVALSALIVGGGAFVKRALEGLRDQGRAHELPISAPVSRADH
jgi:hypothetical protein